MKKIIFVFLLFFMLCSCKNGNSETIEYLNKVDAQIYLFNEKIQDDYGLKNFSTISSFESDKFTHPYTCIIIDVEKSRPFLTQELVDSLYDVLLLDKKIIIMFYKAENYNFFKGTKFANEKDYYENVFLINIYENFKGSISNKGADSSVVSYLSCFSRFTYEIKQYGGSL